MAARRGIVTPVSSNLNSYSLVKDELARIEEERSEQDFEEWVKTFMDRQCRSLRGYEDAMVDRVCERLKARGMDSLIMGPSTELLKDEALSLGKGVMTLWLGCLREEIEDLEHRMNLL